MITAAMKVHSALGPGLLESTYDACLLYEFAVAGLHVEHQIHLPVVYENVRLPKAYYIDYVLEKCLIVEIKCVENLLSVHVAQVLSYLKLSGHKLGLLINFNVPHLKQGIRRVINGSQSDL